MTSSKYWSIFLKENTMNSSLSFEIALLESQPLSLHNAAGTLESLHGHAKRAIQPSRAASGGGSNKRGNIAVIPLQGTIVQRPGLLTMFGLAVSTQQFTQSLRSAVAYSSISQILIDCDSPGGSVYGTQELANEIYKLRSQKPIVCIANSLCASAAYWIGSQCSEMYCTPGGEVGSIGVYTEHTDISKSLEMDGLKVNLISAGQFKTDGSPYAPLSSDARAAIQKSVDNYYSMFTKSVSRGRGIAIAQVRDGMGQGRCLSATDALKQKMIDGVMTRDQVLNRMASNKYSQSIKSASLAWKVSAARSLSLLH